MAKKAIRPIRIEGNIAYVPLTKGYEAIIDAEDVPLVEGFNWIASVERNTVYAVRREGSGCRREIRMHRVIMGDPDGLQVDHRHGNGLDNRRSNLRVATGLQNSRNARIRKDNSSGFKGVSWNKSARKWHARIKVDGSRINLGNYETPEAAHAAYAKASAELHGEFGRIA